MSRTPSGDMLTTLQGDQHAPILLVKAEFDAGTLRLWNGIGELTWDSQTWTGAGTLLNIEPLQETIAARSTGMGFRLSGLDTAVISLAENEDVQERPISMWLGELDGTGVVVTDPVKLFRGRMDLMVTDDNAETAAITLTAETRVVDQERPHLRQFTHEEQQIDFPGDKGLEFVAEMQDVELVWGR